VVCHEEDVHQLLERLHHGVWHLFGLDLHTLCGGPFIHYLLRSWNHSGVFDGPVCRHYAALPSLALDDLLWRRQHQCHVDRLWLMVVQVFKTNYGVR